jgi:hypothetical protein
MLERVKNALVQSFVGAIAIGWLFANGIVRFVTGITTPLTEWMTEQIQQQQSSVLLRSSQFRFQRVISEWIAAALLLLVAYQLLRWLYFEPRAAENPNPSHAPKANA